MRQLQCDVTGSPQHHLEPLQEFVGTMFHGDCSGKHQKDGTAMSESVCREGHDTSSVLL
jgi:hypothetical protein